MYRCLCTAPFNALEGERDLSDVRVVTLWQGQSWDRRSTGTWRYFTGKLVRDLPKRAVNES